jgi:formylglycine-generating enzyme required for sulfatase activity
MTGRAYRLPSEAEWEYACQANTAGYYAGKLDDMAWYGDSSGRTPIDSRGLWNEIGQNPTKYLEGIARNGNQTHPVGQKKPNSFGLSDMHGNVWEWCEDVRHDNYNNAPTDGSAWMSGGVQFFRVVRGGSWGSHKDLCHSTFREFYPRDFRDSGIGVRVAVSAMTLVP